MSNNPCIAATFVAAALLALCPSMAQAATVCPRPTAEHVEACTKAKPKPGQNQFQFQQGRGIICFGAQQYSISVAAFTTAMKLDNCGTACISNRGRAYLASGNYDNAASDFAEVLRASPRSASTHKYLSVIQFKKGNTRRGIELAQAAIELSRQSNYGVDSEALYVLGLMEIKSGDVLSGNGHIAEAIDANNRAQYKIPDFEEFIACYLGMSKG